LKKYLSIIILLFFINPAYTQEAQHKWQRYSGKWNVSDSKASEINGWTLVWNFYELLDYNTIISLNPVTGYHSIDVTAEVTERLKTPSEFMISFAVTSESQSWFYHMYAFKFTGGFWGINNVSLIHSDRSDKSKSFDSKSNFFKEELASAEYRMKYNKMYYYRIIFEGTNVSLYINGEKVLSSPFPEKSHDGRIAISARNAKISVDKVEVKQGNKIVFEDDFTADSIYVKMMKASKQPAPKGDKDKNL